MNGSSNGQSLTVEVTTPAQEADPLTVTLTTDKTTPDPTSIDFSNINPETMDPAAIAELLLPQETSASAVIGPEGGEFSVTSTTGVKYTYRIPPGALDDTIPFTLIPLSAVDGAPLTGSLLGAVNILPEGLELNEPAILTIEPLPILKPVQEMWSPLLNSMRMAQNFISMEFSLKMRLPPPQRHLSLLPLWIRTMAG